MPNAAVAPGHLQPTHITVTFTILTKDKLRKIIFTLSRNSDSQDDSWQVTFELDERADNTKPFTADDMVAKLDVKVDHDDVQANQQAASTAKHGLDPGQRSQALVAADTAKDAASGQGDVTDDDAKADALAVVTSRDPGSPS